MLAGAVFSPEGLAGAEGCVTQVVPLPGWPGGAGCEQETSATHQVTLPFHGLLECPHHISAGPS